MYSLLIVEDEMIIRDGFFRVISEFDDFSVTAVRSGEEALQVLETGIFDTMLLDIKLPGMSGLDLLDYIRDQGFEDIVTIIISGFNDFDYAQRAVDLHVFEYILKPVTPSRIREVIGKLRGVLEQRNWQTLNVQLMEEKIAKSKPVLKQLFFNEIIEGVLTEAEIFERADFLDIPLKAISFRVILIKSGKGDSDAENEFIRQAANQNMYETITGHPWIEPIEVFNLSTSLFAVVQILPYPPNEFIEDYTLLKRLNYKILRITGMKTVFGIGNWVQKITEIKKSYQQASVAIIQNSDNSCRYYKELVEVDIHNLGSSDESSTITAAFIKLDEQTLINIIDKKIGGSTAVDSLSFINFIVMYLHIALSIINEYAQIDVERIQKIVMNIFTALTKKAVYRYQDDLNSLTGLVIQTIKLEKIQLNNDLIQRVKKKIIEQYASEIRISELARDLGYSPNHLGSTFKKATGQTIHDFLHLERIEKAKKLLKKDSGFISEIAEQVGYSDQYYFSNVFKRYTGLSPKEFRNS